MHIGLISLMVLVAALFAVAWKVSTTALDDFGD